MHVSYVRVPARRRARWVWLAVGFVFGVVITLAGVATL